MPKRWLAKMDVLRNPHRERELLAWLDDREWVDADDVIAWRSQTSPTVGLRQGVYEDLKNIGWRRVRPRVFAPCPHRTLRILMDTERLVCTECYSEWVDA